ncbi:MAG: PDZ domain-containing protein [Pirellulales bacterium]|nr:PDZ domain-containing protein [Pirellulales bacterium]
MHPRLLGRLCLVVYLTAPAGPLLAQAPAANAEPGYLGLIADDRNEQGQGVRVLEIVPSGPAALAGIAVKDLITAMGGQTVRDMTDLAKIIGASSAGQKLEVALVRGNEKLIKMLTLGKRPPPGERRFEQFGQIPDEQAGTAPSTARRPWLGIRAKPLSPEARDALRAPVEAGAHVTEVVADSPAARAGIRVDSVIVALGGQVVDGPATLSALVQAADLSKPQTIEYYYDGAMQRSQIQLVEIERPAASAPAGAMQETLPEPSMPEQAPADMAALQRRVTELEARLARIEEMLRSLSPQQRETDPSGGPALP